MLVGGSGSGAQSLIRFNPDVSVDTVLILDEQTALSDVATTTTDDVIVLGHDGVPFIEQACVE